MTEQDPLSQLRDIHLPEPGGMWPPAPGWWAVAALTLAAAIVIVVWLVRKHRRNRWLKAAHAELDQLQQRESFDNAWFAELNSLLKRCARTRYPAHLPQNLSGNAWTEFLLATGGNRASVPATVVEAMVAASWTQSSDCDPQQALTLARQWLRMQRC